MAKPLKRPGAAPAPAATPAPAPAPAPVAAAPARAAAPAAKEKRKREEKREERIEEKKPSSATTAPAPTAAEPAAVTGAVETPATEVVGRRGLLAAVGIGPPVYGFTEDPTQPVFGPQAPDPYEKYYEALDRVEDLRRRGKIGVQVRKASTAKGDMEEVYRPALRPLKVTPKPSREPIARQPILRDVEMPTAEELDIRVVGARKMQEVMRNRGLTKAQQEENQMEIARLEDQLSTQRDQSTFDPEKSRAEQMQARAEQMGAISSQLKQLAAQQRGLTERLATQNATLREYGMTDEEIKSR